MQQKMFYKVEFLSIRYDKNLILRRIYAVNTFRDLDSKHKNVVVNIHKAFVNNNILNHHL